MGFDAFLKIDSIDGESADENHPEWIEIIDYGFGVRQTVSTTASSAGGASAERADFREFKLRKLLDKASPKLAQASAQTEPISMRSLSSCIGLEPTKSSLWSTN